MESLKIETCERTPGVSCRFGVLFFVITDIEI